MAALSYSQSFFNEWCKKYEKSKGSLADFSKISSDEERVRYLWQQFNIIPVKLQDLKLGKCPSASQNFRNEGNAAYKKKNLDDAILNYNKSLAHAQPDSYEVAVAYGNRAASSMSTKQPRAALIDVRRSLNTIGISSEYKQKMINREVECFNLINKDHDGIVKSQLSDIIPQLPSGNDYFDSASKSVSMQFNDYFGRHLVAQMEVLTGDILIVEKPFASILLPDHIYTHCTHCFAKCQTLIPCRNCNSAMYCNEACLEESLKEYHSVECELIEPLIKFGMSQMEILSLRILIISSNFGKTLQNLKDHIDNVITDNDYRHDDFRRIYALLGNGSSRTSADLLRRTFTACMILLVLKNSKVFPTLSPDLTYFAGGMILRLLQILPCNAHEISEFRDGDLHEIAGGAYATLSLLNHTCDPNVVRKSYGSTLVLRAIRPIQKGEQIVDNYGYHYATHTLEERQQALNQQYQFTCCCEPCRMNWPIYSQLPSGTPSFRESSEFREKYSELTEMFEEKMRLVLRNDIDYETIEFMCSYLDYLDETVDRPWQNYNKCQEAIKHALNFCSDYERAVVLE